MPRSLWLPLLLLFVLPALPGYAQQRAPVDLRRDQAVAPVPEVGSSGAVTPTPEMWFYQQELKRHDDPKQAVARRAEARAFDRHQRLSSMQWYGLSNSRPTVSPTPWWGGYSTYWGSNTYDTLRWRSAQAPVIVPRY